MYDRLYMTTEEKEEIRALNKRYGLEKWQVRSTKRTKPERPPKSKRHRRTALSNLNRA